jgi:hypothetical protein
LLNAPATCTIVNPNSAQTQVNGLIAGIYDFQLTVTDNSGATGKAYTRITVTQSSPNLPPTVNAGSNQIITLPANTTKLVGTATDPDGTIASYQWTMTSGPAACTISQGNASQTNVSGLIQGVYKFQLTATDSKGISSQASVQVIVNPAPPVDGLIFKVSPNPATSVIYVSFEAPLNGEKTKFIITDATGRVVYQEEFNRPSDRMVKEINVSRFMRGAYILSIDTGFDMLTSKFLKN